MQEFENLPTGKPHISYSELRTWKECSWKHKKAYIEKVGKNEKTVHLIFGTTIHAACEEWLKTKNMDVDTAVKTIEKEWEELGFENVNEWTGYAKQILAEVPEWFDKTFPGWELVEAEHFLYEEIEEKFAYFKGYIDAIIKVTEKGKTKYWVLDWKTSGPAGWLREKRQDVLTQYQVGLYKLFINKKMKIDLRDIRTGFIILKKGAKKGKSCDLFRVSLGPVPLEKAKKMMSNMIASIRKNIFFKNRDSCKYCEFKDTKHCT